jgi:hypothetical protein
MGPGTKCRDDILECGKSEPHIRCVNAVGLVPGTYWRQQVAMPYDVQID